MQIQKTFAYSTRIVWASNLTRTLALTQLKKSTNKIECGKEFADTILIIVGFFFFFYNTQAQVETRIIGLVLKFKKLDLVHHS